MVTKQSFDAHMTDRYRIYHCLEEAGVKMRNCRDITIPSDPVSSASASLCTTFGLSINVLG